MEPVELPKVSGFFRAKRWMEERIGTSIELIEAGDPEAIAIMEANLEKELAEWRRKLQLEIEKGNQKQT